jgi:acetolactate synthase I/II/III large subunit
MKMSGADLIIHLLERQGIHTLAGIPGGTNLPLYDALARHGGIRHVLARHEQGAGFIAQGMARVSGTPQVCFATSGPGATNILTAIADARLDSVPLVCITGQVPRAMIGTDAFQEVDTYGMSVPITKHNFLVRTPRELLDVIPAAFRIAASGRPGPVLIDVPKDVQSEVLSFDVWPAPGKRETLSPVDLPSIRHAADLINTASKPVLLLGGGVISAGGRQAARSLMETASMPAAATLMGLAAVHADHPLALGLLGMHGAVYANFALEECDLVVAAGVRFNDRTTGRLKHFCPKAKIIHIDIDHCEINKLRIAHLGIVGDIREVLEALLPLVEKKPRSSWPSRIAELKKHHPLSVSGLEDLCSPRSLIRTAAEFLDDNAIIATDVGQHQMWTAQTFPFRGTQQWLTSGGLGTMGFGIPAAIGASLAAPERTVLCFSGDGSAMMNLQELATAVEIDANVKILLMDNKSLGLVRQQQSLFFGNRRFASSFNRPVDFALIARGFGLQTWELAGAKDWRALLAEALKTSGPALIHAPVKEADVLPMVPPGEANKNMIQGDRHDRLAN